jgi:hypothetical protein
MKIGPRRMRIAWIIFSTRTSVKVAARSLQPRRRGTLAAAKRELGVNWRARRHSAIGSPPQNRFLEQDSTRRVFIPVPAGRFISST